MRGAAFMLGCALAAASIFAGDASAGCERYGSTVTLIGHVSPAASSVPGRQHDLSASVGRTADLLVLDVPLCVASDVVSAGVEAALTVQLACAGSSYAAGSVLSVTGRLFGAHTGNRDTPVILACSP